MKSIENFTEHLECPLIDGIVFPDGTIQVFDVKVSWEPPIEFKLRLSSTTSIDELEKEGKLSWCSCAILDSYVDDTVSLKAFCGEGSWGGDGFVALWDLKKDRLIWIAYFTSSNPFNKVTIKDSQVIAVSTLSCAWEFNIEKPFEIEVL